MSICDFPANRVLSSSGALYIFTGGMKGRKTAKFLHFFDGLKYADVDYQLFKPECDYRKELHEKYGIPRHHIVSRTGQNLPGIEIDDKGDLSDLEEKIDLEKRVFGFDEFHLYQDANKLKNVLLGLRYDHNKTVVVAGLDRYFNGESIPCMAELMAHSTVIEKTFGSCDLNGCSSQGELSQRLVNGEPANYDDPPIVVGASEAYETRCSNHHIVPGKTERKILPPSQ